MKALVLTVEDDETELVCGRDEEREKLLDARTANAEGGHLRSEVIDERTVCPWTVWVLHDARETCEEAPSEVLNGLGQRTRRFVEGDVVFEVQGIEEREGLAVVGRNWDVDDAY